MAKNKKRNGASLEDANRKQQTEEGTVNARLRPEQKEEQYEEEQSRPGKQRNDRPEQDSYNELQVGEAAVEAGDKPDTRRQKQRTPAKSNGRKNNTTGPSSRKQTVKTRMASKGRGPARKTATNKVKSTRGQSKKKSKSR